MQHTIWMDGSAGGVYASATEIGYWVNSLRYATGCSTMFHASRKESSSTQTRPLLFIGTATSAMIPGTPQPSSIAASMTESEMDLKLCVRMNVPSGTKMLGRIRAA